MALCGGRAVWYNVGMSTIIYSELGRRELGAHFCWLVEQGESDRSAERFSGLSRRTFGRWCRECPKLAAQYARAVQARAAVHKKIRAKLRRLLAVARRGWRESPAKSTKRAAAPARVEELWTQLAEFTSAVRCVRLGVPRRLRRRKSGWRTACD